MDNISRFMEHFIEFLFEFIDVEFWENVLTPQHPSPQPPSTGSLGPEPFFNNAVRFSILDLLNGSGQAKEFEIKKN